MKLVKSLRLAFSILLHTKLRSLLTIIGIIIGVAAVVSIISIGEGLQKNIESELEGLGQDIVTINAGYSRAFEDFRRRFDDGTTTNVKKLSNKEIQALKLVPGIKYINGIISGKANVNYLAETASLSIEASDPSLFKEFITIDLESGRYLSKGDSRSVVIGNSAAKKIFKNELAVGHILTINNLQFRIIGILEPAAGFGVSDNQIFMSIKDARQVLKNIDLKDNEFSSIRIKINDVNFAQETIEKIEKALMNVRHVRKDNKDFTVISPVALQERFKEITRSVTIFLGAIATVSLIVGAIGVANTMFTSVLEKTKDIGIMKAIGAKNKDILLIFLFNSGMLGLVGGIIGIGFGSLISYLLPQLSFFQSGGPGGEGLQTAITPELLIFALAFSIIIGMIAGVIPAYRASKLNPVDALRNQ